MSREDDYMAGMPSDADLKRLHWRAHHRGTKEADLMIGGFFDAHYRQWGAQERALFAAMLDEQEMRFRRPEVSFARPPLPDEYTLTAPDLDRLRGVIAALTVTRGVR